MGRLGGGGGGGGFPNRHPESVVLVTEGVGSSWRSQEGSPLGSVVGLV